MGCRKVYSLSRLAGPWVVALLILAMVDDHRRVHAAPLSDTHKKTMVSQMYSNYKKEFPEVLDIAPEEVMCLLEEGEKVVLVDVRSPEEQRVSMLPGALPRDVFLRHLDSYRGHYIIGYCTISHRSGKLAQELRQQGLTMLNLEGGLLAWLPAGGEVWARGAETRKVHVFGKSGIWPRPPTGQYGTESPCGNQELTKEWWGG